MRTVRPGSVSSSAGVTRRATRTGRAGWKGWSRWLADHIRDCAAEYRGAMRRMPCRRRERLPVAQDESPGRSDDLHEPGGSLEGAPGAGTSGQEDIAIGTPVAGRTQAEMTEPLIGFFANMWTTLRTNLSGEPSFKDLLSRVKETALSGVCASGCAVRIGMP